MRSYLASLFWVVRLHWRARCVARSMARAKHRPMLWNSLSNRLRHTLDILAKHTLDGL